MLNTAYTSYTPEEEEKKEEEDEEEEKKEEEDEEEEEERVATWFSTSSSNNLAMPWYPLKCSEVDGTTKLLIQIEDAPVSIPQCLGAVQKCESCLTLGRSFSLRRVMWQLSLNEPNIRN